MHNFHIWLHVCSPRFSQEILCNSHGCEKFPALRSCIKALAFSASNIFELWTPVLTDFSGPRSVNKILSNTHRPCQVYVVVVVVVQVWTSLTFSFFLVILFVSILIYVLSFRIFKRRTCFFAIAGHKTHSMPSKFRELFFLQLKICICTLQKTMAQKDEVMYACNHSQRQQCTQQYTVSRRQRQRQNIHSIFVNIIHGTFTCIDCANTPATAHATPFHFAHTETWNTQKRSIL